MAPVAAATQAGCGVELLGTSNTGEGDEARATREGGSDSCFLEWLPVSCWSIIVDMLAARDVLCLSITSKAVWCLLGGISGLWTQACSNALGLQQSSSSAGRHNSSCSYTSHAVQVRDYRGANTEYKSSTSRFQQRHADQQAQQILTSVVSLAHVTSSLKPQLKPQSYLLPPWLGAQPGKARGFVHQECPGLLCPGLTLNSAQVQWLSRGCLSGHSGGVFVSQCTSSPRSRQACGFLAAVVIDKQLVAELYLPSSCTALGRWDHLYQPSAAVRQAAVGTKERGTHCRALISASTEADNAAAGIQFELWVSQLVSFDTEDNTRASEAAAAGVQSAAGHRVRSRRRQHDRHNSSSAARSSTSSRGPTAGNSGIPWRDVYALLIECIHSNAARGRAVVGTAVVPPATAAAAALEQHLAQLVAAGSPVLDLRRFQYTAAPGVRATPAAAQPAGATCTSTRSNSSSSRGWYRQAAHAAWEPCSDRTSHNAAAAGDCTQALLAASQTGTRLVVMQQVWHSRIAAVQTAVSAAVTEAAAAAGAACLGASAAAAHLDDDSLAEVLAAVVKQLHILAPEVQVLVLPVILPGGRASHRLPGGKASSSKLSAPRLLSLNVPYLVPLRHEWDKLQQLKQVLLMVGPPPPLPAAFAAAAACSTLEWPCSIMPGSSGSSSNWKRSNTNSSMASGGHGNACSGNGMELLRRLQQQPAAEANHTRKPLVRGVFSHQQLEQEWQQRALVQGDQQQQPVVQEQQMQQWDDEEWFMQQLGQQHQQIINGVLPAGETGSDCLWQSEYGSSRALQQSSGVSLWGDNAALPGYALEAVQGMLLSCMDRLAPSASV